MKYYENDERVNNNKFDYERTDIFALGIALFLMANGFKIKQSREF